MTTEIRYHTKEEALQAVTQNGNELKFCTPDLKDDEDVVMTAIKQNSWAFSYASNTLKNNKTFIMRALNEGVYPWVLIKHANINIQSDLEVMSLAVEKSNDGWEFCDAKGEVALNKELAAKALVKWCASTNSTNFELWEEIHSALQEFFPKDSWYETAQAYLIQIEQEKQAKMVSGGSKEEDEVVW